MPTRNQDGWRGTLTIASAATALTWIVALCFWPVGWDVPLLLANGPMVAIYGAGFGFARGGMRGTCIAAASVLLGVTHPFWMVMMSWVLILLAGGARALPQSIQTASMFFGTGLTLATVFGITTWSYRAVTPMLAGTVASTGVAVTPGLPIQLCSTPSLCAILHLGIAGGLAWSTSWSLLRPAELFAVCQFCGYDVSDVSGRSCPECGQALGRLDLPRVDQV